MCKKESIVCQNTLKKNLPIAFYFAAKGTRVESSLWPLTLTGYELAPKKTSQYFTSVNATSLCYAALTLGSSHL